MYNVQSCKRALEIIESEFPSLKAEMKEEITAVVVVEVAPERLKEVARFCRDHEEIACNYLVCISGVDYGDNLGAVYEARGLESDVEIRLKVELPRENPAVDSLVSVWPAANFHEREAYDLFGIEFTDHPDLRRILMPEDFDGGHPLRKDYEDERPERERKIRQR